MSVLAPPRPEVRTATYPSVLRPVRRGGFSFRLHLRSVVVCLGLLACCLGTSTLLLTRGDYPVPFLDVFRTIADQSGRYHFVVNELRLPRLLTGLLVGCALGMSGAIMQRLIRNPLGSPDVVGFTSGSVTGALVVIVVFGGSMGEVAIGAIVGGILAATLVYLLAYRRGVQGFRLILIGLGVGAVLTAVNDYLLTRTDLDVAQGAQIWLTGSLNNRGWEHVVPVGVALLFLVPVVLWFGRRLPVLDLGDDVARGLGMRVEATRLTLVLLSVALAAVATASAGPIPFIALAAPQIAARLTRSPGPSLLAAGLLGALLVSLSDFTAQRTFAPTQLPVGIATGVIGGAYLIWLLVSEFRRRAG